MLNIYNLNIKYLCTVPTVSVRISSLTNTTCIAYTFKCGVYFVCAMFSSSTIALTLVFLYYARAQEVLLHFFIFLVLLARTLYIMNCIIIIVCLNSIICTNVQYCCWKYGTTNFDSVINCTFLWMILIGLICSLDVWRTIRSKQFIWFINLLCVEMVHLTCVMTNDPFD